VVKRNKGQYHILLIIADGKVSPQLNCMEDTRSAIIRASKVALSIVVVGVGDGPFDEMDALDDDLPEREFDNLQFVDFAPFQKALAKGEDLAVVEPAFAVCALQEVPQQYRAIADLGFLESRLPRGRAQVAPPEDAPSAKRARVGHG